jgi:hypothetical protein
MAEKIQRWMMVVGLAVGLGTVGWVMVRETVLVDYLGKPLSSLNANAVKAYPCRFCENHVYSLDELDSERRCRRCVK